METWKSIAGYEGLYEVSDLGQVRSLVQRNNRWKPGIMKPVKTRCGYLRVCLRKDGQQKLLLVHRLVAQAFIPNPNDLETVNHKDEVKTNNAASNLEWLSHKDNVIYSQARQIQMFDKSTGELLATFPSAREAERATGISNRNICRCCNRKRKTAGGFIWRKQ